MRHLCLWKTLLYPHSEGKGGILFYPCMFVCPKQIFVKAFSETIYCTVDAWNFNTLFIQACLMVGFIFFLKSCVNFLLNVDLTYFLCSHQSGAISSGHCLTEILFVICLIDKTTNWNNDWNISTDTRRISRLGTLSIQPTL